MMICVAGAMLWLQLPLEAEKHWMVVAEIQIAHNDQSLCYMLLAADPLPNPQIDESQKSTNIFGLLASIADV